MASTVQLHHGVELGPVEEQPARRPLGGGGHGQERPWVGGVDDADHPRAGQVPELVVELRRDEGPFATDQLPHRFESVADPVPGLCAGSLGLSDPVAHVDDGAALAQQRDPQVRPEELLAFRRSLGSSSSMVRSNWAMPPAVPPRSGSAPQRIRLPASRLPRRPWRRGPGSGRFSRTPGQDRRPARAGVQEVVRLVDGQDLRQVRSSRHSSSSHACPLSQRFSAIPTRPS